MVALRLTLQLLSDQVRALQALGAQQDRYVLGQHVQLHLHNGPRRDEYRQSKRSRLAQSRYRLRLSLKTWQNCFV
jgi:hypothetical protein